MRGLDRVRERRLRSERRALVRQGGHFQRIVIEKVISSSNLISPLVGVKCTSSRISSLNGLRCEVKKLNSFQK